jgi:hypothetical protein
MTFLRFIRGYFKWLNLSLGIRTPSPLSPSPWQGEGELLKRGASPLLDTPIFRGDITEPMVLRHKWRV